MHQHHPSNPHPSTNKRASKLTLAGAHPYIYTGTDRQTDRHTHTETHRHTHTRTQTHRQTHTHRHAHTDTHTQTHTQMHARTHNKHTQSYLANTQIIVQLQFFN